MPQVTGLGHIGLFVHDPAAMVAFYADFLGMEVTDRGEDDRIVFLSARPTEEHHELVLIRDPSRRSDVQQVSFRVATLEDLRGFYREIVERQYPVDMVVSHGNAFGCYFRDPEGNAVEVYWPTGIAWPQPHADPIDLSRPAAELLATLERRSEHRSSSG